MGFKGSSERKICQFNIHAVDPYLKGYGISSKPFCGPNI